MNYNIFEDELEKTIYRNAKSNLLNKIANNPDRYIGLFRTTSPEIKLMQNITQSHEISFGDFVENIITMYLGTFYNNLPKKATYNGDDIMFDQLFSYENKIFMIEQKIRDDHDSTKKRGQFTNFISKVNYLKDTYPQKEIIASMWFVDNSLKKNKKYYSEMMLRNNNNFNVSMYLFYGDQLFEFLNNMAIWTEVTTYLQRWKSLEANNIQLNFEENWPDTKNEIIENVPKKIWKKFSSFRVLERITVVTKSQKGLLEKIVLIDRR